MPGVHRAAFEHGGRGPEVLDARVGARAEEHGVDADLAHRGARRRGPCRPAPARPPRGRRGRPWPRGPARAPSIGATCAGLVPHVTCGRDGGGVEDDLLVEGGALVGGQRPPVGDGGVPVRTLRGMVPVLRGRRRSSRRAPPGRPGRRPRSTCCRASSGPPSTGARMAEPRYSMMWPMPPPVPMAPMMASATSLAVTPGARSPSTVDGHRLRAHLGQRLGGQDVLDLAGPDAEGEGAEGAVCRGVAVAADDRHAGLRPALLGADDVDDALVGVAHRVAGDAELGACCRRGPSAAGPRSGRPPACRCRWSGTLWSAVATVRSGRRTVRPARRRPVEGLRRRHLVEQVEVDEEEVGLALGRRGRRGASQIFSVSVRGAISGRPRRCRPRACRRAPCTRPCRPALRPIRT